ncbi:hypothetical protein TB1_028939 [Malus domestica]
MYLYSENWLTVESIFPKHILPAGLLGLGTEWMQPPKHLGDPSLAQVSACPHKGKLGVLWRKLTRRDLKIGVLSEGLPCVLDYKYPSSFPHFFHCTLPLVL